MAIDFHCYSVKMIEIEAYGGDGDEDLDEQTSQTVLDVFILHFQKVVGAFLHELERSFELFNRHHLS